MRRFAPFLLLFLVPLLQAQTPATCTNWTFFNTFTPSGINRWGTVVGYAPQGSNTILGYIRYSNGYTKTYKAPNSTGPTDWTFLYRRNAKGQTVGLYRDVNQYNHGLLLSGSTTKTVDYPGSVETILYGINNYGSMVGIWGLGDFSQAFDGFKMWSNGNVAFGIHFPGAYWTNPMSISDTGVIVGWYRNHGYQQPYHGFVLANGVYTTFDYPNAPRTFLNDINSSGVIAGTHFDPNTGNKGGFLVVSGKIKDIVVPNYPSTSEADGINGYGYVTGVATGPNGSTSFIAHCQ